MYNQLRKQGYSHHHHHHHHHHSHHQINEKELKQSIMDIVWTQAEKLVQFLYILLDTLLSLLVRPPIVNGHLCNSICLFVERKTRHLFSQCESNMF